MASSFAHHLFNLLVLLIITTAITASAASNPKTLLLTVTKDSTSQYITKILQRTPAVPITLTLDLANSFLWVVCEDGYISSTFHSIPCGSAQCTVATSPRQSCNNNTCITTAITNPITHKSPPSGSKLATDVVKFNSTNGSTTGKLVTIPDFLFVCAPKSLLQGLAKGVTGVGGLGRRRSNFSFAPPIFALCMPESYSGVGTPENGAVFLGDGPYNFSPAGTGTTVDVRTFLKYTPLLSNPVFNDEYFIGVTAIKIGKDVPINKSLLSIDESGRGGTTISLVQPYTVLETSIFKAVVTAFEKQLNASFANSKRVAPMAPFEVCYDTLPSSRIGPAVPNIELVLQNKVVWFISGTNSISKSPRNCLAFVDGGKNPRTSIVIGGYQIEDNLLQFDMPKNRLGFSSTLIPNRIGCNTFNFTSKV